MFSVGFQPCTDGVEIANSDDHFQLEWVIMFYSLRSVLIVNDNIKERSDLAVAIRKTVDCTVIEADSPEVALELLQEDEISVILTDLFPPDNLGLELLKKASQLNNQIVTIVGVPTNQRDVALEALKLGAFFCLNTPYNHEETIIATSRASSTMTCSPKAKYRDVNSVSPTVFTALSDNHPACANSSIS